ncbi:CRISPR-associated protein Csm1 [Dyadobacter jejuensis]|uniref:CRISPR system single-strand-specific deoxyribonuclease Cas10/Csm1 (subtype III-A) n=1 Tax=Dyadobacter jejuensis TaxID=1082580 RepID=A0A316AKD4_9BACT|nr:type III-A CRISPR-associated protein Cas10/Csm1 [Dyadobacter jejuensis]PWJ57828.1 CRISPR-associated protein Csm1 [Dyadobacter jejuensis]
MAAERDMVYLAALLHDIGKFWQRADVSYNTSKYLEKYPYIIGNAGNICPTSQEGYFKYQHVIWTQLFFEENLETFEKIGIYDKESVDNLVNLSIHHHKPESKLQALIQFADWWASGIDRSDDKDFENDVKRGKLKFKEEPLINIFGNLNVYDKNRKLSQKPVKASAFGLEKLSLKNTLFPSEERYENGVSQEEYTVLWSLFSSEFKKLPTDSLSAFNRSLHYLLKKYCWCIPASTVDFSDNSLFDHLKITAAITQSLYDYEIENPDCFVYNRRLSLKTGHLPLLLLSVDTSGIQKFIYDISSKYAGKSLKGRSFSLQLMLDEIAYTIVNQTETSLSHVIYSSGGKFFMLLPNTKKVRTDLLNIETKIKKAIWEKYKGNIYICMGYDAFAYDKDLKKMNSNGNSLPTIWIKGSEKPVFLGDLWRSVSEKTAETKYQKFKELLKDDFESFFHDKGVGMGGLTEICSVTGDEVEKGITQIDDEVKISPQILEQKKIGEALSKNHFIVFSSSEQPNLPKNKFGSLNGRDYWIIGDNKIVSTENAEVCLTVKGEIDFLKPVSALRTSYSYRFYGGSEMALDSKGNTKTFEQLAGIEREDHVRDNSPIVKGKSHGNFNRIAILRMDVDGLGQLFIKGFNPAGASFSAYATLSGQLDWFFSGYLNTIRGKDQYKDWINIIYSGGDDIFAVGRWDSIISFANEVQVEFKKFTGRSDITISAGISIVTPKFPIAKGAHDAGIAEENAKDFTRPDGTKKNALCLFGIPFGWEEFKAIEAIKNFWIENLKGNRPILSKGILHKVFDWYEISNRTDRDGKKLLDLSWRWNAAYSLKRYETKETSKKNHSLKVIESVLMTNQFDYKDKTYTNIRFDTFIVACRWAELELKDNRI